MSFTLNADSADQARDGIMPCEEFMPPTLKQWAKSEGYDIETKTYDRVTPDIGPTHQRKNENSGQENA